MRNGWWKSACLGVAGLIVAFAPATAQTASLDPGKVQAWADSFFKETMSKTKVPGAVIVVVDHGRIIVLKGYGVTTPVGGKPIDPQTTLFRLGSITKTLTAIAATQMLGEHKIALDQDVNHYLKRMQVPATYAPITIADLLAHEGGFGADLRGVDAPTNVGANIGPAEIQRLLVPRVRPPGEYIAYDNNGWGTLGLALADASGMSYRQLIQNRIFGPLGMSHAVIGLPDNRLSSAIEEHYVMPDGTVRRIDHSLLKPMEQGAGDGSATGADMARYMIALLQGGQIDGKRILSPDEFHALTDFNAHRIHPMLPGYARAFYEDRPGGYYAIRHDGGMAGSADSMELYPQQQIGVYFAINARPYNPFDGETLSGLLVGIRMFLLDPKPKVSLDQFLRFLKIHDEFAKKFLPPAPPEKVLTGGMTPLTDAQIASFAGTYVSTNARFASFAGNLQEMLLAGLAVAPAGHGSVLIGGKLYKQIHPGLFEDPKTGLRDAFVRTRFGTFMGPAALWISKRVKWYETPVITVLPLIVFPIFFVFAAFYRFSDRRSYRDIGTLIAILAVLYVICVACEGQYANAVLIANRMWLSALWRLPLQLVLAGLLLWPFAMAREWWREAPSLRVRGIAAALHFGIMALCSWMLVWLAGYWNLLGKL